VLVLGDTVPAVAPNRGRGASVVADTPAERFGRLRRFGELLVEVPLRLSLRLPLLIGPGAALVACGVGLSAGRLERAAGGVI
jgi:hypothetical protein